MSEGSTLELRRSVRPGDAAAVRAMVAGTGMFSAEEIAIAESLVQESLERGAESGYEFLFADRPGGITGYACFGRIPCTKASFDLYWIAVEPDRQNQGLGRRLLRAVERQVSSMGGERIYVDTSGRTAYLPTRAFYERCGYAVAGSFPDFYAPGDAKVVYVKVLEQVS